MRYKTRFTNNWYQSQVFISCLYSMWLDFRIKEKWFLDGIGFTPRMHILLVCSKWPKTSAVQTQPEPDNPVKPPDDNPIPARTEGPIGRWWVSVLKNRHRRVEWRVRISKTRVTQTWSELQKNPAKSWKNKLDPARSWPDLARSRPDPAISGGI